MRASIDRPVEAASVQSSPPDAAVRPFEQELERKNIWLRFSAEIEAQFQSDTLDSRRRFALVCSVIGDIAICLGSKDLASLFYDAKTLVLDCLFAILGVSVVTQFLYWRMPRHLQRHWHADAVCAFLILAMNVPLVVVLGFVTRVDTAFTHASAIVSAVMFGCIAVRLRFVWALASTLLTYVAFVAVVHGATAQQVLIVRATSGLMLVSYFLALIANYSFEYHERRNWLLRRIGALQLAALSATSRHLHQLSIQDPLTQLFNRRHFDATLNQAWSRAVSNRSSLALLMIDADYFKRYNDTYGHPAGDVCLVRIGKVLGKVAETCGGFAARVGGEEFALLLEGRTLKQAVEVANALCEGVCAEHIEHSASEVSAQVTLSVGVAQTSPIDGADARALANQADLALYQAKANGRNQVFSFPELLEVNHSQSTMLGASSDVFAPQVPPSQRPETWVGVTAPAGVAATPLSSEAAYTQILQSGFGWLKFPSAQEAEYSERDSDRRRKYLVLVAVIGQLIYHGYFFSNRAVFIDIRDTVIHWQVGIATVMLALAAIHYAIRIPVLWCEAAFSGGSAVMGIASAWVLSQSEHLATLSFAVFISLIPMFAGAVARQPFWFTGVAAIATLVAAIVFFHPHDEVQQLVSADSITLIFINTVFTLILSYSLEHEARKKWLLTHIERLQGESLQQLTKNLHELSMLDSLTGICNRRRFELDLGRIWDEAVQERRHIGILIIDVDFFKRYNDGYGHLMGDRCLQQVAEVIVDVATECKGIAARLGGEEFAILVPGVSQDKMVGIGQRVCESVRKMAIEHRYTSVPGLAIVTVSVGAASLLPQQADDRHLLLAVADDALYRAKSEGRNRVAWRDVVSSL